MAPPIPITSSLLHDDPSPPRGPVDWLARTVAEAWLYAPRWSPAKHLQPSMRQRALDLGGTYFTVRTSDGHRLDALHIPALPSAPARTPVLYVHGYMEVKELYLRHAAMLRASGHSVTMFDMRAHGRSTGRCMAFGAVERHDLTAVIDAASKRGWIGDRVITMGMSFGGATVLQHAPTDPRVAGVVSLAPFADAPRTLISYRRKYAAFLTERFVFRGFHLAARRAGFRLADGSAIDSVRRIDKPVLLVVGERDTNLPPHEHARVLAEACGSKACTLLEVPGADHFNLMARMQSTHQRELLAFCAGVK